MLEIKDLCVSYGAIDAVKGISLKVNDGEIVSLIGANGAGKTTTLHTITGLVPAKSGSITYDGHDLLKTHANKIVTLGMAHVPEGRHVFTRMSVQENLEMGAFSLKDQSSLGKDLEMVFDYFPRLKERRRQLAGTLSGGEQQMVAMGRALMSHPKTILMDEPSMGLSPLLVKEIFDIIVTLRKQGHGQDHSARGAEREDGPVHRGSRLRARDRQDHHGGQGLRPAARREGAQGVPRRVTSHITMLPLAGATSRSEAEGGYRRFPATTLSQLR